MNWISRKVFLYKVTFGLYVLEWWEQCLFIRLISPVSGLDHFSTYFQLFEVNILCWWKLCNHRDMDLLKMVELEQKQKVEVLLLANHVMMCLSIRLWIGAFM
ncbi:hypothetical protein C4D60_Mb11t20450 [Musa balbisiana]|uniref:Uncharacterized protein n=1 Tax=Musa balbisiana TaxID=52838 RepID=A0A4V4H5N8_MUSBA|nr:hypothetical protein C4D60_Mb11t20450 [Musa balbisiana]